MKYEEFGAKTLLDALKHQWKFMIIVVLIFALIGVGAGAAFAEKGVGEAAGEAEVLPVVEYSNVKMTWDYYTDCRDHLVNSYKIAVSYQKNFAEKNSLTTQQMQNLADILLQLDTYSENVLSTLERKYSVAGAVYVPEAFYDEYAELCQQQLDNTRNKLEIAQAAAELLATMDAPTSPTDATAKNYDLILSTAASSFTYMQTIQFYEAQMETLQDKTAVLQAEAQMKQLLADATEELNNIINSLCSEANTIAQENHVIYSMKQIGPSEAEFTLRHTHAESTVQESFVLIVLFCALTGICISVFFAIYRECKKQKKSQTT